MKAWIAAAWLLALAGSAQAQPVGSATERLEIAPYPAAPPWKKITDKRSPAQVYIEWIPAAQSVEDISDILTHQAFYDLKDRDPAAFMAGFLQRFAAVCRDVRINGPKAGVENGFSVAYGQVYCVGHKTAHQDAEVFAKALSGHDGLHVVQREFRRAEVPGRTAGVMAFPKDGLDKAKAMLDAQKAANDYLVSQVRLCAPGPGCAAAAAAATATATATAQADDESLPPFVNGVSTEKDVRKKMGRPTLEDHNPDGRFILMYQGREGAVLAFLFDKAGVLIRVRGYQRNE
jgi:hypothetical protein